MEQDRWIEEPEKKKNHSKSYVLLGLIALVVIASLFFFARKSKVESLLLDKTIMTLGIDESDVLRVTVMPGDLHPHLLWESSDESIAKVADGVVTPQKPGNAVIKVTVMNQTDKFATCEYTIVERDIDMETLDILEEPLILRPGGHQQLTVNFTPENQNEMILWSSSDESVARVSPRGKVEALKVGYVFIIATSERTGVSDTAAVSVEGYGVNSQVVAQVDNPQTTSAPASATASAPVSVSASARTSVPASTPTSAPAPVSVQRHPQTATARSVQSTTSKPAPATGTKMSLTSASKTTPVKVSKQVQTTTLKSASSTASKPASVSASKTTPAKVSKSVQTTMPKSVVKTTSKAVQSASSKAPVANTAKSVSKTVANSSGSKNFGYATYKGSWPNDVKGRMDFKSAHVIDSRDPKGRVAQPGDYVIGEWSEGHLVQGVWYGADNKAKGSILIGK